MRRLSDEPLSASKIVWLQTEVNNKVGRNATKRGQK
jgi:hypothetical protein